MSYTSERRREHRLRAIEHLGGHCFSCRTTENLEFDHIDPTTKKQHSHARRERSKKGSRSNRPLWDRSWSYIVSVLPDYQLLCRPCHRAKSESERTALPGQRLHWEHGTTTGYFAKKCKCDLCCAAQRRYSRRKKRATRLGLLVGARQVDR